MEVTDMDILRSEWIVRGWRLLLLVISATAIAYRSRTYVDHGCDFNYYTTPLMVSLFVLCLMVTGVVWCMQPLDSSKD